MDAAIQGMTDLISSQATAMPASAMPGAMNAGMSLSGGKTPMDVIDKKSKDFEGMFMAQMLQPMFEGLEVDKVFGGGHGEEMMRSFLVQEYGKAIAAHSHLGIADAVKKEMIRAQDDASNGNTQPRTPGKGGAYGRR